MFLFMLLLLLSGLAIVVMFGLTLNPLNVSLEIPIFEFEDENDGLYFFAAGGEEKTEKATSKKLEDAKKKGQVPKSPDVSNVISLVVAFSLVMVFGSVLVEEVKDMFIFFVQSATEPTIVYSPLVIYKAILTFFLKFIIFLFIPIMLTGIVSNVMQTGFILTNETMKPKFSKLNPINGFKEMFSQRRFFDFLKNAIKLAIVSYVSITFVISQQSRLSDLPYLNIMSVLVVLGDIVKNLVMRIIMLMAVISAVDYGFQRYDFMKRQRMTKQEIKEEYKQSEGDPYIKGLRRQRQRQMAMNRMMAAVPEATVIVTNPTHFAIAIKYDHETDPVPKVVAKGLDMKAQKIKEIANLNDVPIIENKPLARTLYKMVEVDHDIPMELYQAVAELLGMVYKLQQKKNYR